MVEEKTKIGYARVSTRDQSLDSQIDALKSYGCSKIFSEKVSGRKTKRTELDKCLDYLRAGDTLVIYKLDRLGRTTKQLIELAQWLENNDIDLQIINMNISTKDAMGKMFFTMMSAFAELEANLLSERTKKGLESARARGRLGGRPSIPDHKKREVKFLYDEQKMTVAEIATTTKVSQASIYRIVKNNKNV
ncbi:TPA: recombinase family protein [Staphylococcus aureus]|uniref:recombinase family protein n=1 Tax=Staphylococcus capitis TaxID=29388 RepID=UPI00064A4375|nr:recombinase family protein [Staphylococcus capitis]AKL93481.1 DNA-invertase hin [Staphylococcus capitis subsp. capitis]HDZ6149447.1 recombinase family protein [Staphylococcus aureus]HDZ6149784.1 recombinase family protein [Staphylococcus aureus]